MKQYTEGTAVSVERSRTEVETVLNRYGATKFMYYREGDSVNRIPWRPNTYARKDVTWLR